MKNESPLPSRKDYHRNKENKKKRASSSKKETELPSLTLIRVLALLFIGMVSIFLLYSYFA
ncbi:hypothetical protein AB986_01995 [Alkalihalobacillus macyae]|uniref:Uncharacterized protein n=1 Tax=Guptibacillus hwajinpoensis TaxID=208199 RepID=A0A0J6CYB0_9BACL|nr:hypothetical protein AB986_01995 [Alkalihalobacillus macyae]